MKYTSSDRSFVHEQILLHAGMLMAAAVVLPHISGEILHAAFHDVTNHLIISALFEAFSLHWTFRFGTKPEVVPGAMTRLQTATRGR